MKPSNMIALALLLSGSSPFLHAQNFFERWQARATKIQNEQPHWVTPLVTVTPRLEQEFRADFLREYTPTRGDFWNFDNGKGLELIPFKPVELIFNVPPYEEHNVPTIKDGFGDTTFLMKYRIFARNE